MPVNIIDTLKPKNGLNFPVVEAIDVFVENYGNLADAISHFATDAMIAAINAVLSGKANTSDVNTYVSDLQAQIDQIVISASAEAIVAPEVAQARVGEDGTSYTTLKERLDAEDEQLKGYIGAYLPMAYPFRYALEGRYVNASTGEKSTSNNYSATNFIPLGNATKIKYSRLILTTANPSSGMAFFSAADTSAYISGVASIGGATEAGSEMHEVAVPAGATHAQFTWWAEDLRDERGDFSLYDANNYDNAKILDIESDVADLNTAVSDLSELTEEIDGKIIAKPYTYTYALEGRIVNSSNGEKTKNDNFCATNFIPLNSAKKIRYSRLVFTASSPTAGMAFFSTNETSSYISGVAAKGGGSELGSMMDEVDVPEGATYAQFTWFASALRDNQGDFSLYDADEYYGTIEGQIENVEAETSQLDNRVTVLEGSKSIGKLAMHSEVIQSKGVQAAVLRARQYTDITWTPVADMPGIKKNITTGEYDYVPFKEGVRQHGIPYSRVDADKRISSAVSFECFATAVLNPNSYIYTHNIYSEENKRATAYGVVCSKMTQDAWGVPQVYDTQEIVNLPGLIKIANPGAWDENDIRVGDGVIDTSYHCTICTDILRDDNEKVCAIEISEAVTPTCRRLRWNIGEFFEHFANYGLYRYQYIDNAVYRKSPYIDVDDGLTGEMDIPIAIRRGSYTIVPKNASRTADVDNSRWITMHILHNGTETTQSINDGEITIPTNDSGYYEVWPTDAQDRRGNSSYYYVEDTPTINYSVDGSKLSVSYSADCPASYIQWTGGTVKFTYLDNSGSEEIDIPSNATAFKIAFKSQYGIWWSDSQSLTT